jgi:cathepsin A (carboxypeptidase C)
LDFVLWISFQASKDNYFAIMSFFARFPEFRKNPFFISGESYGGIYVPTLSARVVENKMINFQVDFNTHNSD